MKKAFFRKSRHLGLFEGRYHRLRDSLFYQSPYDYPGSSLSKWWKRTRLKFVQMIYLTIESFLGLEGSARAASLSFYTMVGIVPLFSFFLAFSDSFEPGSSPTLLLKHLMPQSLDSAVDKVALMGMNHLDYTRSTKIAGLIVGSILLCYSAYYLLGNVEGAFCSIWQVSSRSFGKKFKFIILTVLSLTLYALLGNSLIESIQVSSMQDISWVSFILLAIFLYIPLFIGFWKMPNKDIVWKYAAFAAFITLFFLCLLFWGFDRIYNGLQYQVIYGVFSSLILFAFFLHAFWTIILVGVHLNAVLNAQTEQYMLKQCKELSPAYRQYMSVIVASYVFKVFADEEYGQPYVTLNNIRDYLFRTDLDDETFLKETIKANNLCPPSSLLTSITQELEIRKVLKRVYDGKDPELRVYGWSPADAMNCKEFTVGDLLFHLNFEGQYDLKHRYEDALLEKWTWNDFVINSMMGYASNNVRLVDLDINTNLNPISKEDVKNQPNSMRSLWRSIVEMRSSE